MISQWLSSSYELKSRNASAHKLVNIYPQNGEGEAISNQVFISSSGQKQFSDVLPITGTEYGCRGLYYTSTGRLFSVFGGSLVETTYNDLTGLYTSQERFKITELATQVSMIDNGRYLVIVDGASMNLFNMDTDLREASPVLPFEKPLKVEYINSRVVCICADNNPTDTARTDIQGIKNQMLWWSEIGLDGVKDWRVLSFYSAMSSADPLIMMAKNQGQIILFGAQSVEFIDCTTNADVPFKLALGTPSGIGCNSPNSVATLSDQCIFVGSAGQGKDQIFVSNGGYRFERISNHAVEDFLNSSGQYSAQSIGFTYQEMGHSFYVLTILGDVTNNNSKTFVYDFTTNKWHYRSSRSLNLNVMSAWEIRYAVYAFNKVVCGNNSASVLLELDKDTYSDWDRTNGTKPLVRIMQGEQYRDDLKNMTIAEFALDMEMGVGIQTGQGDDPQAMLEVSGDGGQTWSSEIWTSIGRIGQYSRTATWRLLGTKRRWVMRVTISDPVYVAICGARLDARGTGK